MSYDAGLQGPPGPTGPTGAGGSQTLQQTVNLGNGISNYGGLGVASITSTNFTSGRTLYLNNDALPTVGLVDNANASHKLVIDIDTLTLNSTPYNWSSIVNPSGGPTGPTGPQGDAGPTPWALPATVYNNGESYNLGAAVTYEGGYYYRTGNPLNPGYAPIPGVISGSWTPVADGGAVGPQGPTGETGATGPALQFTGYTGGILYTQNGVDVVSGPELTFTSVGPTNTLTVDAGIYPLNDSANNLGGPSAKWGSATIYSLIPDLIFDGVSFGLANQVLTATSSGNGLEWANVATPGLQNKLRIVPTATGLVPSTVDFTSLGAPPNSWIPDSGTYFPIAGGNNNGWRAFKEVGTSGLATKVQWFPYNPYYGQTVPYLAPPSPAFTKNQLKSLYAVIYTKNRINIQGNLFFNIFSYNTGTPPLVNTAFTTRWDYSIGTYVTSLGGSTTATSSQTLAAGYRYLIFCEDLPKLPPQTTATVAHNALVIGTTYTILTVGGSDFTLVGAAVNTVGCVFVATGTNAGSGSGTVTTDVISVTSSGTLLLSGMQTPTQTGFLRDPYDIHTDMQHIGFNAGLIVNGGNAQPANINTIPISALAISTTSSATTPTLDFTVEKIGWSADNGVNSENEEYTLTY
jgi:hypothetical protein